MSSTTPFKTSEDIAAYILRELALMAERAAGVDHDEDEPAINIKDKRLIKVKDDIRTALESFRKYHYNLAAAQRIATTQDVAYWDSEKESAAEWALRTVKAVAEIAAGFHKGSVKKDSVSEEDLAEMKQDIVDYLEHYHGACFELAELMVATGKGKEGSVKTPLLDSAGKNA